jgi:hypothetical protein
MIVWREEIRDWSQVIILKRTVCWPSGQVETGTVVSEASCIPERVDEGLP